jgi:rhodanese-related sulfurtransferase
VYSHIVSYYAEKIGVLTLFCPSGWNESMCAAVNTNERVFWGIKSSSSVGLSILLHFLPASAVLLSQFEVMANQEVAASSPAAGANRSTSDGTESEHGDSSQATQPEGESKKLPGELVDNRPGGPYCGIDSLFACLSALGIDIDPVDLISVDYVGSFEGSSEEELVRAAEHAGAKATCVSHMTCSELQQATTPMILHTRSSVTGKEYDHWVAFLGMDDNRVRISDAPHPLQLYSMAEVLANWDGTAVMISRATMNNSFLWEARLNYLVIVGLLFIVVYSVQRILSRILVNNATDSLLALLRRQALEVGIIVILSLVLGLGWNAVSQVGFFNNPTAVAEVTRRYYLNDLSTLTLQQTEEEMKDGQPLLLDARFANDYSAGSLPGAKSMSIDASLPDREKVLAGVPKSRRIIVFCQSAHCSFADEVAGFLNFNGYQNLAIYREGYREWENVHSDKVNPAAQSPEVNVEK